MKMRILVVDDNEQHRRAAHAFLKDHDLTVVGDFEKAQHLLARGGNGYKSGDKKPPFDAVLTDLMLPASDAQQGPDGMEFVGQEMPIGTILMLRAIACGVKYVACVTDMNHHHHPASAAFDRFGYFVSGETIGICGNDGEYITYVTANTFEKLDLYVALKKTEEEVVRVKDWSVVLHALLNNGDIPNKQERPPV